MPVLQTAYNAFQPRELFEFTNGIDVDSHLAVHEVDVQKAWVVALGRHGYISEQECAQALSLLDQALDLIKQGSFVWSIEDEDIHMNLERFITERNSELGKKIHQGRSRNDLIATTLRLFVADTQHKIQQQLGSVIGSLQQFAEENITVVTPGMTHCQHGQPIRFSQMIIAHGFALARDLKRLSHSRAGALEAMPLGASAFSGTTLDIDLFALAKELGFTHPSYNGYDSVGDRDFIAEALDSFGSVASHLRRFSQDVIFWSSTAVGLLHLPMQWSTGSSIMPNKRNPDVLELIRAKCSKIIAASNNCQNILSALPSSYSSDLHELKGVYLQALNDLQQALGVLVPFVNGLKINRKRAAELLTSGQVLATALANNLVASGMSWRDAYQTVASLVDTAEKNGLQVHQLSQEMAVQHTKVPNLHLFSELSFENVVEASDQTGGTALERVKEGIEKLSAAVSSLIDAQATVPTKTTGRQWELEEWL